MKSNALLRTLAFVAVVLTLVSACYGVATAEARTVPGRNREVTRTGATAAAFGDSVTATGTCTELTPPSERARPRVFCARAALGIGALCHDQQRALLCGDEVAGGGGQVGRRTSLAAGRAGARQARGSGGGQVG